MLSVYNALFGLHPHVLSPNWWAVSATRKGGQKFVLNLLLLQVCYAVFKLNPILQRKRTISPSFSTGAPVVQLWRESTHRAADFRRRDVQWLVTTVHVFSKLHDNMQHSVSCYIIYVSCSTHPLHNRPLLHRHHAALTTFIAQTWCECSLWRGNIGAGYLVGDFVKIQAWDWRH